MAAAVPSLVTSWALLCLFLSSHPPCCPGPEGQLSLVLAALTAWVTTESVQANQEHGGSGGGPGVCSCFTALCIRWCWSRIWKLLNNYLLSLKENVSEAQQVESGM